jgi:hypothetical protein
MDALVHAALLGTARATAASTNTPAGILVARLPETDPEHALLLRAGTEAIYRQAGSRLPAPVTAIEPTPPETLAPCSTRAAHLFQEMFDGQCRDVLPEALARLKQARRRLPVTMLPTALSTTDNAVRDGLLPVIGERGRWLSRFNPAWHWALTTSADDALPTDVEARWQEGTNTERISLLRRLRMYDPGRARDFLKGVWKLERADFRAESIQTLAVGIAPDDEPFLEAALDDRAHEVRSRAAALLQRLPQSALMQRMIERAQRMLAYDPIAAENNRLLVTPVDDPDATWRRDGIDEKQLEGSGKQAPRLTATLACVPPSHWVSRFQRSAGALIQAAAANAEWGTTVLDGWRRATLQFEDVDWADALAQHAVQAAAKDADSQSHTMLTPLLRVLPTHEAEQFAMPMLARLAVGDPMWISLIRGIRPPWSAAFGMYVLGTTHDHLAGMDRRREGRADLFSLLPQAAHALPPECLHHAVTNWVQEPEDEDSYYWKHWIGTTRAIARMRTRIMEEIPL